MAEENLKSQLENYDRPTPNYRKDKFSKADFANYQNQVSVNNKDFFGEYIRNKKHDTEYRQSGRKQGSVRHDDTTVESFELFDFADDNIDFHETNDRRSQSSALTSEEIESNKQFRKEWEEKHGISAQSNLYPGDPYTDKQLMPTLGQQEKQESSAMLDYLQGQSPDERRMMVSQGVGMEMFDQSNPVSQLMRGNWDQNLPFKANELVMPEVVALGQSLMYGTGMFVSGIGDMVTFVQHLIPGEYPLKWGDPVGDSFRYVGNEIQDAWGLKYTPESLNQFTWDDLSNARFWTKEVAQVVPDAVSMFLGGYGVARGAVKVTTKIGTKAVAKGTLKAGVRAGGTTISKGKGFGKMFTTAGSPLGAGAMTTQLTRNAGMLVSGVGGGFGMNFLDGARVAGNGYNEAIKLGLDHDVAGDVASGIFIDNAKWLPVDMLSFGFTYSGIGAKLFGKQIAKNTATKSGTFSARAGRLVRGIAKTAGVMVPEGVEEMFQETYQDWMVGKNLAHAQGKLYTGPNGENYEGSFLGDWSEGQFFGDGYWNYFNSIEGQKTAAISAILGAGMGGGAYAVSTMANRNRTIDNREDLLNMIMDDASLDEQGKKMAVLNHVLSDAFATGATHEQIQGYLDQLLTDGKLDEENHVAFTEHLSSSVEMIQNTPFSEDMSTEMKAEYFRRSLTIGDLNINIEEIQNSLKENLDKIDQMQGMTDQQKQEAKEAAILESEEAIGLVNLEIQENQSVQAAIVNSVITQKGSDTRSRYKKGVTKGAKGESVRGGQYAPETDQLTSEEQKKYTKKSQTEQLSKEYKEKAIENLEKYGIETTEDNILQEMKRLSSIPKKRTGILKTIGKGIKGAAEGIKAGVKGIRKGVKTVRESGIPTSVAKGVKSAVGAIRSVLKGEVKVGEVAANLAKASGKVASSIFSNVKTFAKQFGSQPIYQEDGTPTDSKFIDKIMETLEENSGVPFTKMNDKEKRDIIEQLFPDQNMDQISNMTSEEFNKYVKEKFEEIENSQEKPLEEKVSTGSSPQQEAKKKRDKEKQVRFFAESIAEGKSFTTKEEKQFYENNKKAIEEELKNIQKEQESKKTTPKKKRKGVKAKKKVETEEKQAKKNKKKVDPKKKKDKRPDPFGNKRLKVQDKNQKQSPDIDRFGATTAVNSLNSVLKYYKEAGGKMDKTAIIVLQDLSETLPSYVAGMALGGATFIRANSAWQEVLAHEYGGHIFYRAFKHTQAVKDGIKNIIGSDLWKDTQDQYYHLTMFKFTNPVTGEVSEMTLDDITKVLGKISQDKRTKLNKSDEAEYRNIRESMTNLYEAMISGNYNLIQQNYRKLETQLKAANMISDLNDSQQEALKEEAWSRSTEVNSKVIVEQLLGAKRTKKHEGYAKRFWNRAKNLFGKEEVSIPLLKKLEPSLKNIEDNQSLQENLTNIINNETARPTVNTYSNSSYMLRSDLEGKFEGSKVTAIRPWISSLFRDLGKIARKQPKKLLDIAKDESKLEKYISDSFTKLGFRFNHTAFGSESMKTIKDFVKPLVKYHALTIDPDFKSKVKELTLMDWFEDLSSRDVSEEILNDTSKELLTEQDWLIKGKEMIDDFMIRQGMSPDEFLENMEGDGKVDHEIRKGETQAVSLTVQRLIKSFVKERYSQIKKGFRKVGDKEVESYEQVRKALRNAKVLQGDLLLAGISSRYDAHQFIEILRSSENVQTAEFINWLENKFGSKEDANAFLMMMHKEFSDRMQENFYGVSQVEDATGTKEFITKQLLSFHENNMIENISNMLESFYGKKHKKDYLNKTRTDQILAIVTQLDKGLDTNKSISLLKMLVNNYSAARNYIDWTTINFNGITIDGKTMSIKKATEKYIKKSLFKRGGEYYIKSSALKPLIEQLVIQSRKKNYVTLINNIEGKPTNISNKSSFITRKVETINDMFRRKGDETLEEYSERVDSLLQDNEYNIFTLLAAHEQEIEIGLRSGMDSEVNNQSSVYERMSGIELLVGDMSQFFEAYKEGEVGSYNVPIAVFAEKSRRYGINGRLFTNKTQLKEQIEKLDYLAGLTYKDGSLVFPMLTKDGKFNQKWLDQSVKKQLDFIKENPSVFKNKSFSRIVDPKTGVLKKGAKKYIELMIMNYNFNRIQAQRLLIGRHENYSSVIDYSKRAAGAIARHIPFDKNINMDVIMFEDIYKTEEGRFLSETEAREEYGNDYENLLTIVTDGSMFILEEQAEEIKNSYGPLNDFGLHYKFVYNGSNQKTILPLDKSTSTESMYLKGNTFVLTDEAVKDSVYLQNIKSLLESRNSYFEKQHDINYNNMFTIAASNSTIKSAYNKNNLLHSVSGVNKMTDFNNVHSVQEENYSDGTDFVGMEGHNFGVQLILDTDQKSAPLSIQLFSNIMINGNKHSEKVLKVLDYFAKSMKAKSNERVGKLKASSTSNAVSVSRKIMMSIGEWAGSSNNNLAKNASPLFPKNNIIKNSLGGNALAQTGARIYLDQLSERHGAGVRAYQSSEGFNLLSYTNIKTRSGESVFGSEFIAPNSLKQLGYKVGDVVIGTRIPGKSKADHAVLVIKDFHSNKEGAKITLPSELSKTIGSDLDGDAIFLAGRYNIPVASTSKVRMTNSIKLYNKGFDALVELLQEPDFRKNEIQKPIDIKSSAEQAIREAENNLGIEISKEIEMNTPLGDMEIFNENIPARGLIGIITNLARDMHYLSFHNVGIKTNIIINGITADGFNNNNTDSYFPVAQSQNVALDNAKYLFASNLGMNKNTVKSFVMLQRLGFTTGQVATIMNSEASKLYNKHVGLKMVTQKSHEKINIDPSLKALYDLKNKGKNVEDDLVNPITKQEAWEKVNFEYKDLLSSNIDNELIIDFKDIKNNPDKFNLQVLKLLYYTNNLSKEIQTLSNLLGIYKRYPKDSFAAKKIKDDIVELLSETSLLEQSSMRSLLNNPIINRNIEVLNEIDSQYRFTNIVDSNEAHQINILMEDYTEEKNPMGYHPRVARNYGLIKMEQEISYLQDLKTKEELLEIIQEARIMNPDNIALHEAISLQGQRNYETNEYEVNTIRINKNVVHEYTSDEIIEDYKDSFSELPSEVQRAVIQLDYLDNRWAGGTTAYIWSNEVWDKLNPELEKLRKQVSDNPLSENHLRDIALEIIKDQFRLMPRTKKSGSLIKSGKNWKYSPGKKEFKILELQNNDQRHYIKHWDSGLKQYVRLEYIGGQRYKSIDPISSSFKGVGVEQKVKMISEKLEKIKKKGPTKIEDVGDYLNKWRSGSNMIRPSYKVNVDDYVSQDSFKVLDFDTWLKRKKLDKSKLKKGSPALEEAKYKYNKYVDGMNQAQSLYYDLIDKDNMSKFTSEQLIDLSIEFNNPKRFEQEVSKVMESIIAVELANRAALEQSKINRKGMTEEVRGKMDNPETAGLKDISSIKMWLISNNMPSDHPAVQNLIKQMELHHSKYVTSYTHHVKRLARLERDLDRYMTKKYGQAEKIKLLFQNKWADTKYKNIINIVPSKDGDSYIEIVDEQTLKNNNASREEIDFRNEFVNSMKKFGKSSEGYVPHLMMGNYESLMKRGMFGLYNSNLGNTNKIDEVMVEGLGMSGKEIRSFGEWRKIYSKGEFTKGGRKIKELETIRRKAISYLERGVDANGNEIGLSLTETKALLGSGLFKDFASSKQIKMSELGSKDLGKIGRMFIRASVFANGDMNIENGTGFSGMKRMAPLVDGLIRVYKDNNNPKMARYIEEVWKDGYLQNKKQVTFGKVGDKIIDLIIKHTLYIALGFGIIPAIGNVLIGKYNQMRSKGGGEFALGEKRFWNPNTFKRNQLIIDQVMKHEYNVFDDIYSVSERSWIDKLVFWPMNASEKWIQGAAFLATFTEEELNQFKFDEHGVLIQSPISQQEAINRYDKVKREQGRGFSPVDQRLMGMYSWGRAMLQFTRWLPTLIQERFGKEQINRFGEMEIGSYTAAADFGREMIMGTKTFKDLKSLPEHRQEAIRKWFRGVKLTIGVGLLAMLLGAGSEGDGDDGVVDKLYDDIMLFTDYNKMKWTITPAMAFTVANYAEGFNNVLTQSRAQRPGKYLNTGEKKWKTNFYKSIPQPLMPEREGRMR